LSKIEVLPNSIDFNQYLSKFECTYQYSVYGIQRGLKFKSKEYRLISFSHSMQRTLDSRGAIWSAGAGYVNIVIEVGDDNDIAEWAFLGYQTAEGEVVIYKRDSDATYAA
jgi:hypothetical protein